MERTPHPPIRKLLDKVALQSSPDKSCLKEIGISVRRINQLLKKNKVKAECMTGGSVAKGTFLKGDFDVDLFIRFDYETYKDQDLSRLLGTALKPLHPELVHGSRDYFQVRNRLTYEIIPVLDIRDWRRAANVTDMSPLHVDYVRKHLKKNPKLADETRLAKLFCKSAGVYGAESYIQGFSGHVLDLLLIHYGSFLKLLDAVSAEWGEMRRGRKVVIDIERHLKDPQKELNRAKTQSPLILVDPLQPERNAAAAVSQEKFEALTLRAKAFLKNPSEEYFKAERLTRDLILERFREAQKAMPAELCIITVIPLKAKPDVAGAKLRKAFEHLKASIAEHDFRLIEDGWEFSDQASMLYFIIRAEALSEHVVVQGPPVSSKSHLVAFRRAHRGQEILIQGNRVHARVKRKYCSLPELLEDAVRVKHVSEKVQAVSGMEFLSPPAQHL